MFEEDITKKINLAVFNVLKDAQELKYCKTISNGFYPRGENLISPTQFPMVVLEYGTISEMNNPRTQVFGYVYTQPIVAITLADNANFNDLLFNITGNNANKGIGDMVYDIRRVLWRHHGGNFGIDNIIDWNFGTTHVPNVLNIQRLLSSIFVRGTQIDIMFRVWERI